MTMILQTSGVNSDSTYLATTAISCDNPFVMLALEQIQAAIVDDKSPTKQVLDREDYEPPTGRLMLQCKQPVEWEEAEHDALRSFHLCIVLFKTTMSEGVKPNPTKMDIQIKERPYEYHPAI